MQLPGSYRILLLNSQVLALTPEVVWQEHVKSHDDHTKPPEIARDFDSCKKCSRVGSRTQASEDWTLNLWTLNLPRLRWRSSLAESMVTTSLNFRSDCPKEWCKLPTKKIKKTWWQWHSFLVAAAGRSQACFRQARNSSMLYSST